MTRSRILPLLLALAAGSCIDPAGLWERQPPPELGDADLRVAFVGNSLTLVADFTSFVQAFADADGRSMAHTRLAEPGFSLEDHWNAGTQTVLRDMKADVVVLQQGPSTLPQNREHLIRWSGEFAAVIREAGGEPALLMVWPPEQDQSAFPEVWTSYRAAADAVGGLFIPAGQTWAEALAIESSLPLYSLDGFHQTAMGSLLVGMTVYATLYDLPADSVPTLDIGLTPERWETLRSALARSLETAGDSVAPSGSP